MNLKNMQMTYHILAFTGNGFERKVRVGLTHFSGSNIKIGM